MSTVEPSDAGIIDAVTYDVTRDDLYKTNLWLQTRTPMVKDALARRRRMGVATALVVFAIGCGYIATRSARSNQQPYAVAATVIVTLGMYFIVFLPLLYFSVISKRNAVRTMNTVVKRSIDAGHFDHALGECTIIITDETLTCDQRWVTMRMPWAWCQEAEFGRDTICLYFDRLGVVTVPLRAFADDAQRDRFVDAIIERLPDGVRPRR